MNINFFPLSQALRCGCYRPWSKKPNSPTAKQENSKGNEAIASAILVCVKGGRGNLENQLTCGVFHARHVYICSYPDPLLSLLILIYTNTHTKTNSNKHNHNSILLISATDVERGGRGGRDERILCC